MAMRVPALDPLVGLQRAAEAARGSRWLNGCAVGYGVFPPVKVFRQGHDLVLVAERPSVDKKGLDVQVKGRQVRIHNSKPVDFDEGASVHRRDGAFDRVLAVPAEIDPDQVKVTYSQGHVHNGVPSVHVPGAKADRPCSITIS